MRHIMRVFGSLNNERLRSSTSRVILTRLHGESILKICRNSSNSVYEVKVYSFDDQLLAIFTGHGRPHLVRQLQKEEGEKKSADIPVVQIMDECESDRLWTEPRPGRMTYSLVIEETEAVIESPKKPAKPRSASRLTTGARKAKTGAAKATTNAKPFGAGIADNKPEPSQGDFCH